MAARILDGKAIAKQVMDEVAEQCTNFRARTKVTPHLAAVLVGDDPASKVYVKNKRRSCETAGLQSSLHALPATTTTEELIGLVESLNRDVSVHAILVQIPLPSGLDERRVFSAIAPAKDVDGLTPTNVGLLAQGSPAFEPCTPAGIRQILVRSDIAISGQHVVVLGRSELVGTPLALMLSRKGEHADATVTLCHSKTKDLSGLCRQADIVVAAIGRPEFVKGSMLKAGSTVIDVGINRLADGRITGDVDFSSACQIAGAVTPVPGGVGRMTVAMLLANTVKAAERQVSSIGGEDDS